MGKEKPSIPKGMRDFGPVEMTRRNYIFDTIKKVYEKYGYAQIETPAMEKLETLTGKYGEEGDRLIFKVLNSGNFYKGSESLAQADESIYKLDIERLDVEQRKKVNRMSFQYAEKAMKYDLTVPFARYVVQYQNDIKFPFKRYQIQPVWRADSPQHGRYREFYQCDADVVGSNSLYNEVEFVQIFGEVLNRFGFEKFIIKINNRKILSGFAEILGDTSKLIPFTITLDKLDKIGKEEVIKELRSKNFTDEQLVKVEAIIDMNGTNEEKLSFLKSYFSTSEIGQKGVEELEFVLSNTKALGLENGILELDFTLARGLDYYTGCIFEVKIPDSGMGSICGGGRYDDLTGIFGLPGISGVGISFGADRIYDLLLKYNLYPEFDSDKVRYFFLNFGEAEAQKAFTIVHALRKKNIKAILYTDQAKIDKQMKYANAIHAEHVCYIGSEEVKNNTISIKNMQTGEQNNMDLTTFLETTK